MRNASIGLGVWLVVGCAEPVPAQPVSPRGGLPVQDPPAEPESVLPAPTSRSERGDAAESTPLAGELAIQPATAPVEPPIEVTGPSTAKWRTPSLEDKEGEWLPQTEERPETDTEWFQRLGESLFRAIVADDELLVLPFFFPRRSYRAVKDIAHPDKDWEHRLISLLKRDVHSYHRKLGTERSAAEFVRIDINESTVKWVKPGREGNKVGYYRAVRNRVIYQDASGRERELGLTAMISWRGRWYLVHLNGVR